MTDHRAAAELGAEAALAEPLHCAVCDAPTGEPFVTIARAPVHCNVLWSSSDAARRAPVGQISLTFCEHCGHVFNPRFDPQLTTYGATYENSLHHSVVFQGYATELVTGLVDRHDLHGRDIVEVGAGQGDFLRMLCDAGGNRGTGFDPSFVGTEGDAVGVTLVPDFYDERFAAYPADLIICRHVLEHIARPGDFLAMIRRVIGPRATTVFFEVPDATWTLRHGGVWDVIYEHCGYFTPASLEYVCRANGFAVDRIESVFGGQFLTIEAHPVEQAAAVPPLAVSARDELRAAVDHLAWVYDDAVARWSSWIGERRRAGARGVIWGAGSKGVAFLNAVDASGVIDRAVDINPRKHGMFVAGSGQAIVAPTDLSAQPPDFAVVMNPNYLAEIGAKIRDLGVDCELVTA